MNNNADRFIEALIALEPTIKKASKIALDMRGNVASKNKLDTGIKDVDIVTDADFAVQEAILTEIIKTPLINCLLMAEEKTSLVDKFTATNGLTLTLDPIDGTALYASGKQFFSTIVCLNDGKNLLYTFCFYPALNWARRITQDGVIDFGTTPNIPVKKGINLFHAISYTYGEPEKMATKIYEELKVKGYKFHKRQEITDESGSTTLFYLNKIAGFYIGNPLVYDGLCALHYAQIKKFEIFSTVDLNQILTCLNGPYYPGWYIALNNKDFKK